MTLENADRPPLRNRIKGFLARPNVPESVLLPRSLSLRETLKLEAAGHHSTILAVGPNKSFLRDTVSRMIGDKQPFANMSSTDNATTAIMALRIAKQRGEPISIVAMDTEVGVSEGYQGWRTVAEAIRDEGLTSRVVLFGKVSRGERRHFGNVINRVVRKPS